MIGAISSVASIAAEGIQLAQTLNNFYDRYKNAGREVREVACEIDATSAILEQLVKNLELEKENQGISFYLSTHH